MEDILLLVAITYTVALSIGYLLQRYLRMPWMFTVVIFGMFLSAFGLFTPVVKSGDFKLLSKLGMLALLYIIGLDLNLKEIKSLGPYIAAGDLFLCFFEGAMLALLFYFWFPADVSNSFSIALITGVTFATVGEIILLAILAEFDMVNTKFGQLTLGIGVFDDVVEVSMLAIVAALPAFTMKGKVQGVPDSTMIVLSLLLLLVLTFGIIKIGDRLKNALGSIHGPPYIPSFLLLLTFFSFTALGGLIYENLAAIAAIMGGIVTQEIFPERILKENRKAINFLGYFFLSPFFFLSLGAKISVASILVSPLLIILIIIVSFGSRVLAATVFFNRLFGVKYSFIMGVGLCAKFSTSVIAENLLFNSGFISPMLFSAIMTAYITMKPTIVSIYSWGLSTAKREITTLFSIESPKSPIKTEKVEVKKN